MLPFFSLAFRLVSLLGWLLSFRKPTKLSSDPDMIIGPDGEDLAGRDEDADDDSEMRDAPVLPAIPLAIAFAKPAGASPVPAQAQKATLSYMHADRWEIVANIPNSVERHLAGALLKSHGIEARFSESEGDIICSGEEASVAAEILRGTPARQYIVYREE